VAQLLVLCCLLFAGRQLVAVLQGDVSV
jgi:hypothetical protein